MEDEDWEDVDLWEHKDVPEQADASAGDHAAGTSSSAIADGVIIDTMVIDLSGDTDADTAVKQRRKPRDKETLARYVTLRRCAMLGSIAAQVYRSRQCDNARLQATLQHLLPDHFHVALRHAAPLVSPHGHQSATTAGHGSATSMGNAFIMTDGTVVPSMTWISNVLQWFSFAFVVALGAEGREGVHSTVGTESRRGTMRTKGVSIDISSMTTDLLGRLKRKSRSPSPFSASSLLSIVGEKHLQHHVLPVQAAMLFVSLCRSVGIPARLIMSHEAITADDAFHVFDAFSTADAAVDGGSSKRKRRRRHGHDDLSGMGFSGATLQPVQLSDARSNCAAFTCWAEVYCMATKETAAKTNSSSSGAPRWIMVDAARQYVNASRVLETYRPRNTPFMFNIAASMSTKGSNPLVQLRDVTRRYTSRWPEVQLLRTSCGLGEGPPPAKPKGGRKARSQQQQQIQQGSVMLIDGEHVIIPAGGSEGSGEERSGEEKSGLPWIELTLQQCNSPARRTTPLVNGEVAQYVDVDGVQHVDMDVEMGGGKTKTHLSCSTSLPDAGAAGAAAVSGKKRKRASAEPLPEGVLAYADLPDIDLMEAEEENSGQSCAFPTNAAAYAKHPLYALEKLLAPNEALHSYIDTDGKEVSLASLGYFKGLPIYSRKAVHTCRTKNQWYRDHARVIQADQLNHPVRTAVYDKRGKMKAEAAASSEGAHLPMQLYGIWQTDVFTPIPYVSGDPLPKNEHGNMEVWNGDARFVPEGLVFLSCDVHRGIKGGLIKEHIEYVEALVGFERRNGKSVPQIGGVVVAAADAAAARALVEAEVQAGILKAEDKRTKAIYARWVHFVRAVLIRDRIQRKYGAGAAQSAAASSQVDVSGVTIEQLTALQPDSD